MLTQLELRHFKCFRALNLPLGRLTLLSGSNASGKSTVLQAIVLLHQTIREHEWSTRLLLNGSELNLGTVRDVVDKVSGRQAFELAVMDNEATIRWNFKGEDRRDMSVPVSEVRAGENEESCPSRLQFLLPEAAAAQFQSLAIRLRRLTYLTAERIGPREVYSLQDPNLVEAVGPRGENAASLLYWGRDEEVLPQLVVKGFAPTRLHQVEARMKAFFPGFSMDLQPVNQANGVTLGLRTSNDTDFHRPVHVGFGMTQVFPIVVAAVSARRGDLLLIENPEVHLHPSGQSLMGQFLSTVAAAGMQVLVETHSDHVLNGVRRSVKGSVLEPESVVIHFFNSRSGSESQVISPLIDKTGNIDTWPSGFFDQFDADMSHFAGWGP